jgi:hypothetical protein
VHQRRQVEPCRQQLRWDMSRVIAARCVRLHDLIERPQEHDTGVGDHGRLPVAGDQEQHDRGYDEEQPPTTAMTLPNRQRPSLKPEVKAIRASRRVASRACKS